LALATTPVVALALVATPSAHAQTFTTLYTFTGASDGAPPVSTPLLYNGNIYGTTSGGGAQAHGTVYVLNFVSRHETVLHSFAGRSDGANPIGGLVQDSSGNFYGVAYTGGIHNAGTLFEVNGAGKFTLLHTFAGPPTEGIGPAGTLVFDPFGDLLGTTYVGGDSKGWGTVFVYSVGGYYKTGQTFAPGGALPWAGLYLQGGKLYGTTSGGGARGYGGTIFEIGVPMALYTFNRGAGGSNPASSLIGDGKGNPYGTTSAGGSGSLGAGDGVVFMFDTASSQETILHTFTGSDGSTPMAALARDSAGDLYGTTSLGGAYGHRLDPSSLKLTTLHDFTGGADGASPYAGVVVDAKGNIWGATSTGGSISARFRAPITQLPGPAAAAPSLSFLPRPRSGGPVAYALALARMDSVGINRREDAGLTWGRRSNCVECLAARRGRPQKAMVCPTKGPKTTGS
jgi:uncharacterized repeat protein (TIGR03803 family)